MPFKSKSQARYFFANAKKLKAEGVNMQEWIDSTDWKKLPERKKEAADLGKEVQMGIREEGEEHRLPPGMTYKLVLDHLLKNPKYYSKAKAAGL